MEIWPGKERDRVKKDIKLINVGEDGAETDITAQITWCGKKIIY